MKDWTLFCPNEAPGMHEVYGDEFEALYAKYEKAGRGRKTIKAQKLWYAILEAQTETGNPFMLYKDACNRKSNQKNLGTIKSSNLCTEIVEYSAPDEVAVCNLASIALPTFIEKDGIYNFERLHQVTKVVTTNLNKIIDVNYYPVEEARRSNMRHRPVGVGVQGLADAFLALRLPFDSPEARLLNTQIFETIYHAACEASCELAQRDGPYSTYEGSPASEGQLQYDLWGVTPTDLWDWDTLKQSIAEHGMRNSLLVAPMPTASTSQILGFNECFEPYTSNIYSRRVLAGEFQIVNPWLLRDLVDLGLWNDNMKNRIIAANGSIQDIPNIPTELKSLYRTVWEISQKSIIDMAADRGAFIDQSQSLNIHLKDPTFGKITSMHFWGWKKGLKTGMYYLRTQAAAAPIQFTVDQAALKEVDEHVAQPKPKMHRSFSPRNAIPAPMAMTASPRIPPTTLPPAIVTAVKPSKGERAETPGVSSSDEEEGLKHLDVLDRKLDGTHITSPDEVEDEQSIWNSKVIACSIKNPEACEVSQTTDHVTFTNLIDVLGLIE